MADVTLEAFETLAARVARLEQQLTARDRVIPPTHDFRSVLGMFRGNDFMKQVDAEVEALRAAAEAPSAEESAGHSD